MSYVTFSQLGNLGRMGNGLFQCSVAIGYAKKHGIEYVLPPWKYFDSFVGPFKPVVLAKQPRAYNEPHFHYADIPKMEYVDLVGYFQAEKYFEHCKEEILSLFQFKPEIVDAAKEFIKANSQGKIPVAVHQRYTDYITMGHYYHNLSPEWYMEAMNMFDPTTHHFFVMSDDIALAKTNTVQTVSVTFCGFTEVMDLCIGTLCDHNIIANSSFSWWQQYLNRNPNKIVIAPSKDKWFKPVANHNVDDLYLENWKLL